MKQVEEKYRHRLFLLQDESYKAFQSKLIPNISSETIIGVRTPELRKLAKELSTNDDEVEAYLSCLPHKYYEENNLHGFFIEQIKDYNLCIKRINAFLPYVDNWATCDMMSPKVFKKHLSELYEEVKKWIVSDKTYTIRFAVGMLMGLYLDSEFKTDMADLVANVHSDQYYVNMMLAWYFATGLAKQYDKILPYITENRLDKWVHNKAIQKAVESYRVDNEKKIFLKSLKK